MCGRYIYFDGQDPLIKEILKRCELEQPELYHQLALFDVHPGDTALSMIHDPNRNTIRLTPMIWGFQREKHLSINARMETLLDTSLYNDTHPCILSCSAFYEFDASHRPFLFRSNETMFMAGLCRRMKEELRFVILTMPAGSSVKPIHDRQPILLSKAQSLDYCHSYSPSLYFRNHEIHTQDLLICAKADQKRADQLLLF